MSILAKVLVTFGSSASFAFGVWHFFVPRAWKWYSYIDPNATELIVAVRSINVFFSLSLVLFGLLNLLFIYSPIANRFSIIALLIATCFLWLTRTVFQVIYPQGSLYPGLQYGMLAGFVLVALSYLLTLIFFVLEKNVV